MKKTIFKFAVIVNGTRYIVRAYTKAAAIMRAEMEEDKKRGTIGVYKSSAYPISRVA